jgi:hypothetical protein
LYLFVNESPRAFNRCRGHSANPGMATGPGYSCAGLQSTLEDQISGELKGKPPLLLALKRAKPYLNAVLGNLCSKSKMRPELCVDLPKLGG